jgi:hypothetical protein
MARKRRRRQVPWTPCERELRSLLTSDEGVASAKRRPLLTLRAHPAIKARMASPDRSYFEEGLRGALIDAIDALKCSNAERDAIKWQFDLGNEEYEPNWRARLETAIEKADSNENKWWRDRLDGDGELIQISIVRVLLGGIEHELNKQAQESGHPSAGRTTAIQLEVAREASLQPPGAQVRAPRKIRIGRLEIPHAISIAACDKEQSSAQELLLEFERDLRPSRADPDEWPPLEAQLLPVLQEEARKRIAKFEDDPGLDLVHVEHRPSTADGTHRLKIGVAETGYYLWAATANSLDRDLSGFPDLTSRLGHPTLRQGWNSDPSSLADLTRQPAPAYMGVCVVVIAEGQIIVLKRQRDHFVASTSELVPAHFVGEGMDPIKDLDASDRFSPEKAAWRGCSEELGAGPDHFQFIPTGVIVDSKRWQPLFTFVAECNLTTSDLKDRMAEAKDKYETTYGEIAARLPWTVKDERTLALLIGEDPTFTLASNHAQVALLNALYYADGRKAVKDRLGEGAEI